MDDHLDWIVAASEHVLVIKLKGHVLDVLHKDPLIC